MAHTVNNLFDKIVDEENLARAVIRAARGKRSKRVVRRAVERIDETVTRIGAGLRDETYAPPSVRLAHGINDGFRLKKRIIVHPAFDELVVSHAVLQVLKPVFMKKFYRWTCGSIPGRGQESMVSYISRKMRRHPEKCRYYVKLDVAKCFDSIDTEVLMDTLRKYVRDRRVLALLGRIIGANHLLMPDGSVKKVGVPIGLYTSPWFANLVLSSVDHLMKDKHGLYVFVRYIDDMLCIHPNRRALQRAIDDATALLSMLGLRWKEKPVVRRWPEGNIGKFRFCGVHLMRHRIQLHDAVYIRARRTANRILRKKKAHKRITWHDAARIISYGGRFRAFFSYRAFLNDVLKRGNIRYSDMRQKMSAHAKGGKIKYFLRKLIKGKETQR